MADRRGAIDVATTGVGALSGAVAGLSATLVSGGVDAEPLIGALVGLAVGALGGLGAGRLRTERAPASGTASPGAAAVTAGELLAAAGPATALAAPRAPGNLAALVTSIGNRYEKLADRQLDALGELGRDENGSDGPTVADQAAVRAQATRLSRRMRRLAKTLEVLAEDPESPEAAQPATMGDVLRLAIADNDEHERIDFTSLHSATVDGEAVADLVHLLAELIDNAASASAGTGTKVVVLGRRSSDGYLLSVVDEGSGMPPGERDAANGRLSSPPPLAQQSALAFGLPTVGRLADRHGIAVHLLEAATDGLIAKIRIPSHLLDGAQTSRRRGSSAAEDQADGGGPGTAPGRAAERSGAGTAKTGGGAPVGTGIGARAAAGLGAGHGDELVIDLTGADEPAGLDHHDDFFAGEAGEAARADADRGDRRRQSLAGSAAGDESVSIAAATASQRAEAARRVLRNPGPRNGGGRRPGKGGAGTRARTCPTPGVSPE